MTSRVAPAHDSLSITAHEQRRGYDREQHDCAHDRKRTTPDVIQHICAGVGDVPIIICALTVAELAHGIHRANSPERRQPRRQFLDELKATVPVHPVTEAAAEIIARIGSEQAANGINLPLADLVIGACVLELGDAIGPHNACDFNRIPGLRALPLQDRPTRLRCSFFRALRFG